MMKKTKTIKQYSDKGFYIGVKIKADGSIKELNHMQFYSKTRCERDKVYQKTHSEKVKKYIKRYRKTHPEIVRKCNYNRRVKKQSWLSPKPINSYFDGAHLHHLHIEGDHRIAIYIPAELHNSIYHAYNKLETMNKINKLAMEWYYDRNSRNY